VEGHEETTGDQGREDWNEDVGDHLDEAREEGLEQGLERGLEQGRKQLICEMVSRGMTPDLISEMTGLTIEEIETLLS